MIERLPEIIPNEIQEIIDRFRFEVRDGNVDLRERDNKEVLELLYSLKESGIFLFHGTNASERFSTLEARQANDEAKESGNKKAVYADEGITFPLANAVLNKSYLARKLKTFVTAWSTNNGKVFFGFTPNVYELFKTHDPNLFEDGYIYVLNKAGFINAEDAGAEWHSISDQKPVLSFRVSKKLADDLFILGKGDADTVREWIQ